MKSIGIDIGSSSIKVAIIDALGSGYRILDFFEIPLPTDPQVDPYVHKVDSLKSLAERYSPSEHKFIIALPQEQVIVRRLLFPFKQRSKILKSVAFELEDEIPFDQQDAIFDVKILSTSRTGAEVLAFVTPKVYVEETLKLFSDVGIEPDIISCEGAAISNLFGNWFQAPPNKDSKNIEIDESSEAIEKTEDIVEDDEDFQFTHPELIISIGHQTSVFCLLNEKTLFSVRSVPFGGSNITKALQKKYNINYTEAYQTLKEKSFLLLDFEGADQNQITFSNTIGNSFDELINEIKRHLLSIEPQLIHDLKAIWLTGGTSQLVNIAPYITQGFHISSNLLTHLEQSSALKITNSKENQLRSSIAIGLAIEGTRLARNPAINFRKEEFGQQTQFWSQFKKKWGYAVSMAVTAFIVVCVYGLIKNSISKNIEIVARKAYKKQGKSLGLPNSKLTPSKVRRYIRDQKQQAITRKQLIELQSMNSALDIIKDLSAKFPPKNQMTVDIQRLLVEDEFLDIEGYISQSSKLNNLENILKSFSLDGKLKKQKTELKSLPGKYSFKYSLIIDRAVGIAK